MPISEQLLEKTVIDWFVQLGWQYEEGKALGRVNNRQVVLRERLLFSLSRINPHIPAAALEQAADELLHLNEPSLIARNRQMHRLLLSGVEVEFTDGDTAQRDLVHLIDFAEPLNNDFLLVSQLSVQGSQKLRRADLVAFVNGLPLVVIELKNPASEQADIWDAFAQLQTYQDDISELFTSNLALVISDGINARIGSLTANAERMLPWRTIDNENDRPILALELEALVQGFFQRDLLLDYLRHFVLFEQGGERIIKKIAAYHQFHAVREAVKATLIAASEPNPQQVREPRASYGQRVKPGSRKAGVIWHTQGSGKSISMACYAGKLLQQPEMNNPTLLVVTDRNDLDGQLYATFYAAQDLLRQTPVQATSRDELRQMLASRESGGIIFTTIQKFALQAGETRHPLLSARRNILLICDEAHRSQYGMQARLNRSSGQYLFGYAKHLRDALSHATFIGFTGTPIALSDKDTRAVFGDYVSIYDIQDAVDDGATVPIFYESRLAKLNVNQAEIDALNAQVEEVIEDEEERTREKTKSTWASLAKLVGAQPRLNQIAQDVLSHFATRNQALSGKALIVCMSRDICVQLYNAIIALRPDWHSADPEQGSIKVLMTGSASDKPELQAHLYSAPIKKRLEQRFKDPDDALQLVIVRDMWLTGFDAPCCHTLYVDKPMKGHNLMQAIARVNRVFKDKPGGLVVDYIGIAAELKAALKTYSDSKGKGQATHDAQQALLILLEKLDVIRAMLHGFDYSGFEREAVSLLAPAANHLLGLEDGKKRFLDAELALRKAFALCSTLDKAAALRTEIAFFTAISAVIAKTTVGGAKWQDKNKNSVLKQILDNAVIAEGVTDIFALAGLDKPNISLLSDEFLADIRQMKTRNLAVELLEKLLADEIKARLRTNTVSKKKYSERLKQALIQYHNRSLQAAQVIDALIQIAKELKENLARGEKLGLSRDEIAFYDALSDNQSAIFELGDETLKQIAIDITEQLRRSTKVDWQQRESVRAKLRNLVRRALKKWKYPPDGQDSATELVLEQAETLANEWTA